MKVSINLKKLGKRKNSIEAVVFELQKSPTNVSELIVETVKVCVDEYNKRKESNELLMNLTSEQIETMSESGKISFGVNYGENDADTTKAISNAITSFEDNIYRIFLDNEELKDLSQNICLTEESQLTFVRMTMLVGRMW